MEFNPPAGIPFNVLSDPDHDFNMDVTLHEINEQGSTGIQKVNLSVSGHQIEFANDGSLIANGRNLGKLSDPGLIAGQTLGPGIQVMSALRDDGGGQQAERLVVITPEYEITAALRSPHLAGSYFDVNIAERTADAADNSSGDTVLPFQGMFGVDDLLRQEPD